MDLHHLSILVVEDDADTRDLMQALLEQHGAIVATADCVACAFERLDEANPDLIVSDIAMPDEDGYALVRRLRSRPVERGGRTPVIAVSAFSASTDRLRALAAGFDRYLHKPVDFDELFGAIEALVGRVKRHEPADEAAV